MPEGPGATPAELRIRRAEPADDDRVAELIYGHPGPEPTGIAGGAERAAAFGTAMFRAGLARTPGDDVLLAVRGERAVGVLLGRAGGGNFPTSPRALLRTVPVVLRQVGLTELPGLLRRVRLRSSLEFPIPPGSYHIIELHVEPEARGAGIGTTLIARAEEIARKRGCERINLTTAMANPARGLYERLGYAETGRHTVEGYEEVTGSPGRVFMEKALGG